MPGGEWGRKVQVHNVVVEWNSGRGRYGDRGRERERERQR